VRFVLPWGVPPTQRDRNSDGVTWTLKAHAEVSGVDYSEGFEVPIFVTPESSRDVSARPREIPEIDRSAYSDVELPGAGIRLEPWHGGGRRIVFERFRNPELVGSFAFFSLFFAAGTWVLWYVEVPFIAWIPGGAAFFLARSALHHAARRTVLLVEPGWIRAKQGCTRFAHTQVLSAADCDGIVVERGIRTGNAIYHNLRLRRPKANAVTLGTPIRDHHQAKVLASLIARIVLGSAPEPQPTPRPAPNSG